MMDEQDYEPDWFDEQERESKKRFKVPKEGIIALVIGVLIVVAVIGGVFAGGESEPIATGETAYIVLNDERCDRCDVSMVKQSLSELFPGEVEEVDYNTPEGKELYEDTGVEYLPAIFFTGNVNESDSYPQVQQYLVDRGDYLSLRIGADFDPTAEICDNEKDDTGDGLIDCEDPDCEGSLMCREEMEKRLDVFVMSQCPYGTQALDAMGEVLDVFGEDMDFRINYIATETPDGFSSLHGQPEVDENIRELCAIEHYPEDYQYMDYIWCRNQDIMSEEWESCAEQAGMDVEVIRDCFEGDEGKSLLSENIQLAQELGIGASPTWMVNNQHQFGGIDAETIKQGYCEMNPGLEGCEQMLSSSSGASGTC